MGIIGEILEHLGPYELRGELGRGAMAVVWRAWDPQLEREVAIKEPHLPAGLGPAVVDEFGARFVREGRTAASLNHPGIVTIHAADIFDGRPAIVMELVDGQTLSEVIDRGALSPSATASILDQLLDAVAYAHSRGVVHRDIKPDNVFVTRDGRVKLADFGIARTGTATLTQAGTVMGTPGYMSPEQVKGEPVDARSDVFSIGVVAYEMLTGRNPFGATDGIESTTAMYRIVHEPTPRLVVPLPELGGADLGGMVDVALSKDPPGRFVDAGQFRAALHGAALPVPAPHPGLPPTPHPGNLQGGVPTSVPQSSGNSRTPYVIVGVVGVGALIALVVFAGGAPTGGVPTSVPVAAQQAASQQAPEGGTSEQVPEVAQAVADSEPTEGPTAAESRVWLQNTFDQLESYGRPDSGRIAKLAAAFNKKPGSRSGSTYSKAAALVEDIEQTQANVEQMEIDPSLEDVRRTQIRLAELCWIRADAIRQACDLWASGDDIKPPLDAGRDAKNEYVDLRAEGDPR